MPEKFICKQCSQTFERRIDLMNHVRLEHRKAPPGLPPQNPVQQEGGEGAGKERPMSPALDTQEQFKSLLERWGVKEAEVIAEYGASQGEGIFEESNRLAEALLLEPAPSTIHNNGPGTR